MGWYIGVAFAVKVECKMVARLFGCCPYKYMGRYCPKEGKNREKVKFFLHGVLFLLCVCSIIHCLWWAICFISRGEIKVRWQNGERFSRVRASRTFPTAVLFFCCHKCHTWGKKERKREEEFCKTEGWNTRFSMSFPLVYAYSIRLFVKTLQDECVNSSYLVCYKDECDTCDSKNDKTPVMCACAYARRQVIIVILQFIFLQISNLFPTVVLWKVTRRFMKSDTLFYEKRHVVLWEMTRRFTKKMLVLFLDSERIYDECQMFRPKAICFTSLYGLSKAQYAKKDFSTDE